MDQPQQRRLSRRLLELQNETLKREIEMLSCENAELRDTYNELKQSLDAAVRTSRQRTAEQVVEAADSDATEDTVDTNIVSEPQQSSERMTEDGCRS